ncbi:MAG TPA: hypothetical protein VML96_07520 [Egibacteraceae bacterium]|nr:hypothetical protein [Egibacteraceae bacterium]
MKRITTLIVAVLTGLMVFAAPALAEVSGIYQEPGTDVGGVGGELISNVSEPAAAAGGAVAQLAQTGFDLTVAVVLAGALIAFGAAAIMIARRRSAAQA